jgi:hypothetical protein
VLGLYGAFDLSGMEREPDRLRAHKLLYQRAMARRSPELWEIGIAGELSTEDWRRTFARRPDVRSFVTAELADDGSGVWDLLDRDFLAGAFDRLGTVGTQSPAAWKSMARSAARAARPYVPAALAGLAGRPSGKPRTVSHRLIMRAMALKHWHDAYRPSAPTAAPAFDRGRLRAQTCPACAPLPRSVGART